MDKHAEDLDFRATGQTVQKRFTQDEVNKLISSRIKREREKLSKQFDERLQNCLLILQQELQGQRNRQNDSQTKDTLLSGKFPQKW